MERRMIIRTEDRPFLRPLDSGLMECRRINRGSGQLRSLTAVLKGPAGSGGDGHDGTRLSIDENRVSVTEVAVQEVDIR